MNRNFYQEYDFILDSWVNTGAMQDKKKKIPKKGKSMTVYKSKSGQTALKMKDEITAIFGSCFRLDSSQWHYVGDTEPFDPAIKAEELERMFSEMVEILDKQEFDLSKSISEVSEKELL